VDVFPKCREFLRAPHPAIAEASLPNLKVAGNRACATGEAAFDELNGALNGDTRRRKEKVDVIRHDDEFVEQKFVLIPVIVESRKKQLRETVRLEESPALPRGGSDEVGIAFVGEGVQTFWAQEPYLGG
jgi:hypothetical protein